MPYGMSSSVDLGCLGLCILICVLVDYQECSEGFCVVDGASMPLVVFLKKINK